MPCRLVLNGGFTVSDGRHHHLDQQARRLGFASLPSCLQVLLDDGCSVPQLASHFGTTQAAIRRAIEDAHVRQPAHRQRLARQRQHTAQQRATARVAELGFTGVRAYLVDRLVTRAWTLAQVRGELGAAPNTLRGLLEEHEVRRVAPTRRQRVAAAAASGPHKQARAVQQRCQARLAELGFAEPEEYLRDRSVGRGWPVRRLGAELRVGHGWLEQLGRLGLRNLSIRAGWRSASTGAVKADGLTTIAHRPKLDMTVQPWRTSITYTPCWDAAMALVGQAKAQVPADREHDRVGGKRKAREAEPRNRSGKRRRVLMPEASLLEDDHSHPDAAGPTTRAHAK